MVGHRENRVWPVWVTVKNSMKVVGAIFSNNECLDKLNSDLVSKCFFMAYSNSWGIKGTILQKVYFVNTYLFSKLWFTAQCFKLDLKMLNNILSKALSFVFSGENEKPVRPLIFRDRNLGGLGLINPIVKSKALLVKNMYKDFLEHDCDIHDQWIVDNLYGYPEEFIYVFSNDLAMAPVKHIYNFLLQDVIYRKESLIPSRNEKRSVNVKWSLAWRNLNLMKGLTSTEKCFAWKVQQDLLPVGSRIHRINAERRCLSLLQNNQPCDEVQTLEYCFSKCDNIAEAYEALIAVLSDYLGRDVTFKEVVHFSFNHRNKKRLLLALWFAVKIMFQIFHEKSLNKSHLFHILIKECEWYISMNRKLGSLGEVIKLKDIIVTYA